MSLHCKISISTRGYATMVHGRGAIRIAVRQLLQNRKWRHWWRHGFKMEIAKNGSI